MRNHWEFAWCVPLNFPNLPEKKNKKNMTWPSPLERRDSPRASSHSPRHSPPCPEREQRGQRRDAAGGC